MIRLLSGLGENLISTTGANDKTISEGNDTIFAAGLDDTVFGFNGQVSITGTNDGQVLDGKGSGTTFINSSGSGSKIGLAAGTGFAAVTLSGGGQTISGGTGQLTAVITSTVAGGGGTPGSEIGLGSGGAAITLSGANIAIFGGAGAVSVVDAGTADSLGGGPVGRWPLRRPAAEGRSSVGRAASPRS